MAYKDLTFLLFAKDMSASRGFEKVAASSDAMAVGMTGAMGMAGVAVAGLAVAMAAKSVKMAADFETATTRIITDGGGAGESVKTLGKVIMDAGADSGTSMDTAAKAMYKVSSAGYTLANGGAAVLKAALEGAAIGGADAVVVADALTTVMTDFGPTAGTAAGVMSKLTATVATGKTNLQDLASSLHSVLPNAAAAGLGLNEMLAAVGTMTAEGISADQAAQNLNHSILSLQSPSHVAQAAMAGIGVSSLDVAKNLGKRGLAGTYDFLLGAMAKHSHAGLVVVNAFATSAQAAASMKTEIAHLPPALAKQAQAFAGNKITMKEWAADLKHYPAATASLGRQFATTAKHANGFSDALKSGAGPTRTAAAQLEKMLGGTTGLQVALHLTGIHAKDFVKNTKAIASSTTEAGGHVRGWSDTQKTFNQHINNASAYLGSFATKTGQDLIPALISIMDTFPKIAKGVQQFNKDFIGTWNNIMGFFGGIPAKFSAIGGNIVDGLLGGIADKEAAAIDTVKSLVGAIVSGAKGFLGIASPSKVFRQIGRHVGEGLNLGLLGSVDQIKSTSKTLADAVVSAFKHGNMSKTSELYALDEISHIAKYLERLSNKRDALRQKLSGLKTDRSNVHDTTKAATVGYGDITGYAAPGDAVQGLAALVTKTKTFTTDLKALVKKGVKGALLSQLVDGWNSNPDVALTTAQGLLANPTDLKEIIKLQNQLSTAGAGLGAYAGHAEYDSQVAATAGKIKVDTWQMQRVAATTTRTIARASDIHVHVHGVYTGTKDDLAKSVAQVIRDAVKRGTIPRNWATG